MEKRLDPDELLKNIQSKENSRGKLKIFLGYAAGVGKTYSMLEAAHQRQKQGVDVIVGYAETHHRVETEALLKGLEILPMRQVDYHNIKIQELNVDGVLKRNPDLVLVDELAHTNAPGSRHVKRYLDIQDILEAGIDVYTTLNIQHLESLNNVVAQVTGIVVQETVPDKIIDEASEIEVIDLPPEELLTRLKEGKVYIPEQAQRAIKKFFREGNLTALREMSLRRAAERVDDQMRDYMRAQSISGPWPAAERLLVCISASPLSEKLIRTTRHLSDELNADWFAVHVNIATKPDLNPYNQERIGRILNLAEELGARTKTLTGNSVHEEVLKYAKKHNVTKIVVGKPIRPRWREFLKGSIVDQLIYSSGNIDIYVINDQPEKFKDSTQKDHQPRKPITKYLLALIIVALTTVIGHLLKYSLEPTNLVMLYLVGTLVTAMYLGRGPSLLVSVIGVLAFDFFLVPPYLTFAVTDTQYLITFVGLFLVSIVISSLTVQSKEQAEAAIQRESFSSALYSLGRDLTSATDLHQVADVIINHASEVFGQDVAIFIPEKGQLSLYASSQDYYPDSHELAVASWAFEHNQQAGFGTDTLPSASICCKPLAIARGQIGVLGIHSKSSQKNFSPEQHQMINAFTHQATLAIERASLAEQARQAELLQVTEKLQSALLNSISHDLRTPLVSITGALSSLREESLSLDQEDRKNLIETASLEAERLNRLVGNLLNMTRLEANAVHLRLEPCDIQDAIGTALEQVENRLGKKPVNVTLASDLPLVSMDLPLFVQVLVNLLDNAIKYSAPNQPIDISVTHNEKNIELEISDRGIGIPQEDLEHVFTKFFRVQHPNNINGTGLGLAICKGIIEAHEGSIRALHREGGGTTILILLPKESPG